MAVIITHIFNEEMMLKWWMPHHAAMFDHGIVIDYASTDRSLEIVRQFAPDWEIVQSRNEFFRAADIDIEVMDIERGVAGWKCVLTSTEFLHCDLDKLTNDLSNEGFDAAQIKPVAMVDRQERTFADYTAPLDTQCVYGYVGGWIEPYKSRVFHRHRDGAYNVGRHSTNHQNVKMYPGGALLKWYGFAPWTPEMRIRKMQIHSRIPADDVARGLGYQHMVNAEQLRAMWQQEVPLAIDLRKDPEYF